MASMTKSGSAAARSLPVGVERGLGGVTVAKSYQSTCPSEMSEFASSLQQSSDQIRELEVSAAGHGAGRTEEASITRAAEHQPNYGATGEPAGRRRHRRKRHKRKSTSVVSITRVGGGRGLFLLFITLCHSLFVPMTSGGYTNVSSNQTFRLTRVREL